MSDDPSNNLTADAAAAESATMTNIEQALQLLARVRAGQLVAQARGNGCGRASHSSSAKLFALLVGPTDGCLCLSEDMIARGTDALAGLLGSMVDETGWEDRYLVAEIVRATLGFAHCEIVPDTPSDDAG